MAADTAFDAAASKVFDALADPSRRHILALLSAHGPITATALANDLDISRQAVAKHLAMLRTAGLADAERVGRETRFRLVPDGLAPAVGWLDAQAATWDRRLGRLQRELDRRRPS